ncbi:type II secretion system protein [Burkholderia sp. 9775_39]|uniref:type II secretion system protein n=1 Tax=unclassified Burkholderia TaxID=2613784 RepID=UPI0018C367B9|nr:MULTISPECIES: type II secretion system protein [unclassified Burkholderia]MBG0881252.1 type II secretion system protein [Burkholderia sp. 9775_39]MBG0887671.1 type II secretion system protein [Burkholderia sp. 9773_38]
MSTKRARGKGFSLLETAILLVVMALVFALGMRLQQSGQQARSALVQRARLSQAHRAVMQFALTQHRLPCPDTTAGGAGIESQSGGACMSNVGWLPYISLGIVPPSGQGDDGRMRYGVFNGAMTLGAAPSASSLISALVTASTVPPDTASAYVPVDADCSIARFNPAFALALGESATQAASRSRCFVNEVGQVGLRVDVESVVDFQMQLQPTI